MKTSSRLGILACLLALMSSVAVANERVEAAEYAVRSLVRAKMGNQYRVAFETHSERVLSLSEEVVSGRGHIYDGNDWNFDRTFDYSVKVKYDGSSTRDVTVTFTNGGRQVDQGDWKKSNHKATAVHLSTPRWYEKVNTNAVVFAGSANGNISIDVFDRNNRKVASEAANPRSGLFRVTLTASTARSYLPAAGSTRTKFASRSMLRVEIGPRIKTGEHRTLTSRLRSQRWVHT